MKKMKLKQLIGVFLAITVLFLNYLPCVQSIRNTPSELYILEGDTKVLSFGLPFKIKIESDNVDVLKFNGKSLKDYPIYSMSEPISIETVQNGKVSLNFKLFGLIPIKELKVNVQPQKEVIPGGQAVGVSIHTQGAIIVGTSEIIDKSGTTYYPAIEAGLKPGDIIEKVNGVYVKNAEHLSILVDKKRKNGLELDIRRGNMIFQTHITPALDGNDNKYRLGIWVRDSTAGVGTLTFIDPDSKNFGALGHAITDIDTGLLLPVKNGKIMEAHIVDIKQGSKGKPGEIKGVFSDKQKSMGNVYKNTNYGIYGKINSNIQQIDYKKGIPIAYQDSINIGKATILCTIDDEGIKEFDINIVKINRQSHPNSKGMVVEITDPELLNKTGGIVQGMSGSPIIQNGRIVGAITHVLVNDPTKGYAIFIEWMLDESSKIIE